MTDEAEPQASAEDAARPAASLGSRALSLTGLVVGYVVLVFLFGLTRVSEGSASIPGLDKLGHVLVFGGMTLVVLRLLRFGLPEFSRRRRALYGVLVVGCLGGLLELFQAATPQRSPELLDWVADVFGAGLAALVWLRLQRAPQLEVVPVDERGMRESVAP